MSTQKILLKIMILGTFFVFTVINFVTAQSINAACDAYGCYVTWCDFQAQQACDSICSAYDEGCDGPFYSYSYCCCDYRGYYCFMAYRLYCLDHSYWIWYCEHDVDFCFNPHCLP